MTRAEATANLSLAEHQARKTTAEERDVDQPYARIRTKPRDVEPLQVPHTVTPRRILDRLPPDEAEAIRARQARRAAATSA